MPERIHILGNESPHCCSILQLLQLRIPSEASREIKPSALLDGELHHLKRLHQLWFDAVSACRHGLFAGREHALTRHCRSLDR